MGYTPDVEYSETAWAVLGAAAQARGRIRRMVGYVKPRWHMLQFGVGQDAVRILPLPRLLRWLTIPLRWVRDIDGPQGVSARQPPQLPGVPWERLRSLEDPPAAPPAGPRGTYRRGG